MKIELGLYHAMISSNFPAQKANAVIAASETDMPSLLATKADIAALRTELKSDIAQVELKLTLRMGVMMSFTAGVIITAVKFMLH